jgi:tRNA(fMet)-specific endonuclease VapC
MIYLFDTNILLHFVRETTLAKNIEEKYDPFGTENTPVISVVTIREIKSIALRNQWGANKLQKLHQAIGMFIITDINVDDVINKYAEIDTFSQGKLKDQVHIGSSRNMGKNDLWIAASANVLGATLLTTDNDFTHLEKHYIQLLKLEV